jgi:hypothetical protein
MPCLIVLVFPSCHQSPSYAVLVLFGSSDYFHNENLLIVAGADSIKKNHAFKTSMRGIDS